MIATSPTRHARFACTLERSSIDLGVDPVRVDASGKTAPRTLGLNGQLPPLPVRQWSKQAEGGLIPSAFARITCVLGASRPTPLGEC